MQIGSTNDAQAVKEQYATSNRLNTRISFHDKNSTNKQGFSNWLVSNYEIPQGARVLELGCGTAGIWTGRDELIAKCSKLILTDLSEGMLETARENIGEKENVDYAVADIQNLPFEDSSFDIVIANYMLYHVPDLAKGISEVRRVLKDGGTFYCATYGENNFVEKLAEWFELSGESFHPNHNFTLDNGGAKLSASFKDVRLLRYEDSLHITDTQDLVDYIKSLASFKDVLDLSDDEKIRNILSPHIADGAIDLPKDYGTFIAS